jgi:hypothetical protein
VCEQILRLLYRDRRVVVVCHGMPVYSRPVAASTGIRFST